MPDSLEGVIDMNYRHRYDNIVFLFGYLSVVYLLLAGVIMTQGSVRGLVFFVICIAAAYLILRFRMKYRIKKKKEKKREKKNNALFMALILVISFVYMAPAEDSWGYQIDTLGALLLYGTLLSCFAVSLYAGYFQEKYLTMYTNPCVSEETIKRFEENTAFALRKKGIVFGGILLILLIIMSGINTTGVEYKTQRPLPPEVSQSDSTKVEEKNERLREIEEKEKENLSPLREFLLRLLRMLMKIIIILLAVLGIVGVVFLILKKLFSVKLPAISPVRHERRRVTSGIDEYIPLETERWSKAEFPADNNGKIRKCFYRYIRKRAKQEVDVSLTACELVQRYGAGEDLPLDDKQKELVACYEKARYSGKKCSAQEAEQIKEYFS